MSSPSLSSLSVETARLDRQAASRVGRDEEPAAGKGGGAGSFSGLLDQARLARTAEAGDSGPAALKPQAPTATANRAANPPSTAQPPSRPPQVDQRSAEQRQSVQRQSAQRQIDQRQNDQRQIDQRRAEVDASSDAEDAQDGDRAGDRTDPSAASGATPTWLMHSVVRASLRASSPDGDATVGQDAPVGPGSGGTGDVATGSALAATAGGWAGTRGELAGADASAAGAGAGPGSGSPARDAAVGGPRDKGPASDAAAQADVPGKPGAIALDASFQAVPGQESFSAQLAAQAATALAAPAAPVADPGAGAGRAAEAQIDTPVDAPGFGEAVMHKVVHLARDGAQEIKLHLNPIEMGPIQIRIAIESGQARIEFGAAAEATRQALEQAMPALAQSLQADGLNLAAGSGVAASADPTLAGLNGQPPGGAWAQGGGGGGQGQRDGAADMRGSSGASAGPGRSDAGGRSDVRAPVGHELRTGWAGTPAASNGALRALDLYA